MTIDFDDWAVFDRTETVVYTVVAPDGDETEVEDVSALFMEQSAAAALGEMVGTLKRTPCSIRASTLPGVTPAMGDRVTRTDGRVYVVLPDGVAHQTDETRWDLQLQLLEGA